MSSPTDRGDEVEIPARNSELNPLMNVQGLNNRELLRPPSLDIPVYEIGEDEVVVLVGPAGLASKGKRKAEARPKVRADASVCLR